MKRRKVVIVECATFAVMVASATVGWRLSDAEGSLAAVRAGLFGVFTLAAFTLFVAVLVDFDRWVDDVRPYPKRAVRRWTGRRARTLARLMAWMLAVYAAAMTWLWAGAGAALAWVLGGIGAGLTWSWVLLGRAMSWVLVRYWAGAERLWAWGGAGSTWALGRTGMGLTSLWVWLGRGGSWVLVRYRAGVGRLWSTTGRAVAWTLAQVGAALTSLWVWLTRTGAWLLVRFRAAMTLLWWSAGVALVWALRGAGSVLTALWVWLSGVGVRVLVGLGEGIKRLWRAVIGGARGTTTIRRKPWYTTAVDTVFGIPPDDSAVGGPRRARASRRPGSGRRGRAQRPTFREDTTGSPHATRGTSETPTVGDSRARYAGRQATRREERRKPEELLSAALARFRSAVKQPRDADDGGDG